MKPYGRYGFVHGGNSWKIDYHLHDKNHRKIGSWWEEFSSNSLSRTTIKKLWKQEIE